MVDFSSISDQIASAIFGSNGGLKKKDIEGDTRRNQFSKYLPWVYCDESDHNRFELIDDRFGYLWEVTPYAFMGSRELKQIETLFSISYPARTIIQVILAPDPNTEDFISAYKDCKTRDNKLCKISIAQYEKFLEAGQKGVPSMHGIPFRNFRCFFSLKTIEPLSKELYSIIEETLTGAYLHPQSINANSLLKWSRQLFNDPYTTSPDTYDPLIPIRKQVINSDTAIEFGGTTGRLGARHFKVLTPKINPGKTESLDTNKLFGGIMGPAEDNDQICTPFVYTLNILIDNAKSSIANKASATMVQKAPGSFAKAIKNRIEEFSWALDVSENKTFYAVIPSIVVFGDDEVQCLDSVSRFKRLWSDYSLQEESVLAKPMFISSLPFGLYDVGKNIELLDRHFYFQTSAIAHFAPFQGDFRGGQKPVLAYIGRKGQAIGIDVFDPRSNNHNFVVSAGTGSGKSFSLNYLTNNYFAAESLVRVVDCGYSYQKACSTNSGRFIDFGHDRVVINPFSSHAVDSEDRLSDLNTTTNILAEMVYSASKQAMLETEWTLLKEATRWAYDEGETINGVDSVQRYLYQWPDFAKNKPHEIPNAKDLARAMAFNLHDFTSQGFYGRFFNGKSTLDIRNDHFVVLELERLQNQRELFNVVVMQVMNSITQDLYLSDRSDRRFILFEEAWSFFRESQSSRIAAGIEEGYRRARKYEGSFGIVTQSPLDLLGFGDIGNVIKSNAAYKFFLECSDYPAAVKEGVLKYEGLAVDLLESVRNNKPKYGEIFFETPFGRGVGRLAVDPWNYWLNTSAGPEVAAFNRLTDKGLSVIEAIETLSGVKPCA